ncbi:ABC transporter permease [Pigmentiphaga litoralis]|uniref:NitT/TauT family transport system permease protein n=1 Tax=Pigmentiphaga litoralis TaxID=516702 RepID=A0A7Y9IRY5_9BURK|nr:ABC transporter permease [Pigmentiphaga litoralis]NYE24498.1 NitT/TauT family transport system permease protein [Pigmentiphaga litoralis]NYE81888.1 NitT/TauT family transport system permease protein [Pigmentiphaga litoralis]
MASVIERNVPAPRKRDHRRATRVAQRLALLLMVIAIWGMASLGTEPFVLPSPLRVWHAFVALIANGMFFADLSITLYRVVVGFVLAAIVGTVLGMVLGSNKTLADFFEPVLAVMNTVSSAIWAIFAIIWFGISNATTIFVVFMTAMPLVLTNVWQGTQTVNSEYIDLAKTFRMSRAKVLRMIYMPSILPYFFSGARLAFGFGWRVSLIAETLGSSNGIGYRLRQAADLVQTDQVFAWTVTLVSMMVVLELLILKPLENHLFRWKRPVQS